jgi:N-acetylglucosaminyldiphosphoundecaprenol N-acetyl-beta-D-mannosaminyltransferase
VLMEKVNIGQVLFNRFSIEEACDVVMRHIDSNNKTYNAISIQAANVDSVVKSHINNDMKRVVNKFDYVLADGMPIVWASKVKKKPIKARIAGPDFFNRFNEIASKKKYSYFFLGSSNDILIKMVDKIKKEFQGIDITGFYSPPISDMKDKEENEKIFKKINNCNPDFVWVSFGCPKQERWIIDNIRYLNTSAIMGIGAAFDFYSDNIKRAPKIMQRVGLEWFYRFLQEPRRLFKRYFVEGPLFVYYFFKYLNK